MNVYFGFGIGLIWLGNVWCSGNEIDIVECVLFGGWGISYCSYGEDVGVYCGEWIIYFFEVVIVIYNLFWKNKIFL